MKDSITCDPHEVDDIAIRAWAAIYKGNTTNTNQLRHDYFRRYAPHIFTATPTDIGRLTGPQLKATCLPAAHSTAGLDHFTPEDFTHISDLTFDWLAYLLNLVEDGLPWPADLCTGKAAYLSKTLNTPKTHSPTAYYSYYLPFTADGRPPDFMNSDRG